MNLNHYMLDQNHRPYVVSLLTWANWFESGDRFVARTKCSCDTCFVSTIFLGLDHSFGDGPPVLFETMVFGGAMDGYQDRYTTWERAELYHELVIGQVESLPVWKHVAANVRLSLSSWFQSMRREARSWWDQSEMLQLMVSMDRRRPKL